MLHNSRSLPTLQESWRARAYVLRPRPSLIWQCPLEGQGLPTVCIGVRVIAGRDPQGGEAEALGDRNAPPIPWIAADTNVSNTGHGRGNVSKRGDGLGDIPLTFLAGPNPVADLKDMGWAAPMQAGTSQKASFGPIEDAEHPLGAGVKAGSKGRKSVGQLEQGRRLIPGPRHPRHEPVETFVNRGLEEGGILRAVASEDEASGEQPGRDRHAGR